MTGFDDRSLPGAAQAAWLVPDHLRREACVEVTGVRQRDAWRRNQLPPVERVRPGLWSIPVPIPDNPLRYVLVYVFELSDGVAVVDAGWDCAEAWDALVAGLAIAGYEPQDVQAILVTHWHPDHFGLAPRMREASGAWIGMHAADAALVQHRGVAHEEHSHRAGRSQLETAGAPGAVVGTVGRVPIPLLSPSDAPERIIEDGDVVRLPGWVFTALWTPGHTPGHLCFHVAEHDVLLTGDHVLPRISPNVSKLPHQLEDPLGVYLESLRRIARHEPEEVLPAHEYRFRGLGERVTEMLSHHEQRLNEIAEVVAGRPNSSVFQIAAALSWSRDFDSMNPDHQRMAVRETLAHLVLLEARDEVRPGTGDVACWSKVLPRSSR